MAGDLIPPPSPAGRPDRDAGRSTPFEDSDLLRGDAEPAAAEALFVEPPPAAPDEPSRYRTRFGYLTGGLVGVGVAALVIVVLIATGGTSSTDQPWSAWKPESADSTIAANEIALHVGHEYRLDSGDQLVAVDAQPLALDGTPLNIVIRSTGKGAGADILNVPGKSMLFVLHGLGPRGSIDTEEASEARLRLLQRESLELALYTFRYVNGVDNVVTFLPPAPTAGAVAPGAAATPAATPTVSSDVTSGKPVAAMLFRPGDVQREVTVPLSQTLPGEPPRPSTMTDAETSAYRQFAVSHAFSASVVPDQAGAGFLVLDRVTTSSAANSALRSILKA